MFSCIGTIGKCGIASEPTLTNQQINSIVTSEAYDGVFVYYLLRHYAPIVKSIAEGGGARRSQSSIRQYLAISNFAFRDWEFRRK